MKDLAYRTVPVVTSLPAPSVSLAGVIARLASDNKPYWCDGTQWVDLSASGGGALSSATAALAADVSLTTSNQWYDGPAVSLAAGTWLVAATITQVRTATTAETIYGRLTTGIVHYASTQMYHASVNGTGVALSLNALITLAATTTVKCQCATSAGNSNSRMRAATTSNSSGNNATMITALKVG
jgi:hypothetical protein